MIIFGINEAAHDAGITVIENGHILFAAHSERYSKIKNDWFLNDAIINEALKYGRPDVIAYYEKPLLKQLRLLIRGGLGKKSAFQRNPQIKNVPVVNFGHHYSHASSGYFTSKFDDALIVVVDSIGEFNTTTGWIGEGTSIKNIFKQNYPFSFGLFYSAFTQLIGLEANKEEYILMGMAAYGNPNTLYKEVNEYFPNIHSQKYNFHKGIWDWNIPITEETKFDIAAAVQKTYQQRLLELMHFLKKTTKKNKLVFMGGCALNCSANTLLWDLFDDIWIMPNPGDAGSSLGAAAAYYKKHVEWNTPYLGYNIEGDYPIQNILNDLNTRGISAVANGKAEFGPRALGNRSILADPRDPFIKDKVNEIKQREKFRPFAPVVLEEYANEWFDMNFPSPYMQYATKCKRPAEIPSVVHYDGTSRVQTVNKSQHSGLYNLLKQWYDKTKIPILLNTSLNIKNQPLLNDKNDAVAWKKFYKRGIN